jgi:hypothetical protein
MYLFVWKTGQARTVVDNITTGDVLGVRNGVLNIFRLDSEHVFRLTFDEDKVYWIPVKDTRIIGCKEARFHHP